MRLLGCSSGPTDAGDAEVAGEFTCCNKYSG
jgi:hypothetical protein